MFGVGRIQEEETVEPHLPHESRNLPFGTAHPPHWILATGPLHMLVPLSPMCFPPLAPLLMPTQLQLSQGSLP